MAEEELPLSGDTPPPEGSVSLFEPPKEVLNELPPAVGDTVEQGTVHLVEIYERPFEPTAADLRAQGYPVAETVKDDELVTHYSGDVPAQPGHVRLYEQEPTTPGGPEPEEAVVRDVVPEPATAVPTPTGEQQAARTDEERAVADAHAEELHNSQNSEFLQGRSAAQSGQPRNSGPYDGRTTAGKSWLKGYDSVDQAAEAPADKGGALSEGQDQAVNQTEAPEQVTPSPEGEEPAPDVPPEPQPEEPPSEDPDQPAPVEE